MKLRGFFLMLIGLIFFISTGIRGATPDLKGSLKTERFIGSKSEKSKFSEIVAKENGERFLIRQIYIPEVEYLVSERKESKSGIFKLPTTEIRKFILHQKKSKKPRDGLSNKN